MSLHENRSRARPVRIEKYRGTNNEFLVVDADAYVPNRAAFAATYCDRQDGVDGCRTNEVEEPNEADERRAQSGGGEATARPGQPTGGETTARLGQPGGGDAIGRPGADGTLFLALEERYSPPRVVMTLVRPDGSTAAICGNGARVAAAWAAERTGADEVMVDTQAGTRRARIDDDGSVTIEMGVPSFDPKDVPLARDAPLVDETVGGVRVTAVGVGVPHAVAFVGDLDADDPEAVDLSAVADAVRGADALPADVNVTVGSVADDGRLRQRTDECGVEGSTAACGTGAVALAAAAKQRGLADADEFVVRPPDGDLRVRVPGGRGIATLQGDVRHEFSGEVSRRPGR